MQALLRIRRRLCAPAEQPNTPQLPAGPLSAAFAPCCCADVSTASQSNPNGSITYDRHSFNAIVPQADLVEYYLPAWEACATEGKAGSIMCSCESHATPLLSTC